MQFVELTNTLFYENTNRNLSLVHTIGLVLAAGACVDFFAAINLAALAPVQDYWVFSRNSFQTDRSNCDVPLPIVGSSIVRSEFGY